MWGKTDGLFCRVAEVKDHWFLGICLSTPHFRSQKPLMPSDNFSCVQLYAVLQMQQYFCYKSERCTCNRAAARGKLASAIVPHSAAPFHREGCSTAVVGCSHTDRMTQELGPHFF